METETKNKIVSQGFKIIKFFKLDLSTEEESLKLCKQLRALENKAYEITLRQCNEGEKETDKSEEETILNKVDKLLNFKSQDIQVFINGDARGYALKISDKHRDLLNKANFYMDWGGYGIIAPEIK